MTDAAYSAESARRPEVDEVLRRIGRNLLHFQQIEHLLKHLIGCARIEGTAATAQFNHAERQRKLQRQTLGKLAGEFANNVLADAEARDSPEALDEGGLSLTLCIQTNSASVEQHMADLKAILDARNELVHHFLPRWSPTSEESTQEALAYLEAQREQALLMRNRLHRFAEVIQESAKVAAEFLLSPEGIRSFELQWLRRSRLVQLMAELAASKGRSDGWTVLSTAAQIARQQEPEEFEHLAERYGHRTLKKLLQETEVFDIEEEPTSRGGTRTIYRTNPRFELPMQPDQDARGSGSSRQWQYDCEIVFVG